MVVLSKCTCACLPLKNFIFHFTPWELERRDEDKSDNVVSGQPNAGDGSVCRSSRPLQQSHTALSFNLFPLRTPGKLGESFFHRKVNFNEYLPLLWKQEIHKNFKPETLETLPLSSARGSSLFVWRNILVKKLSWLVIGLEHRACHGFWPWDFGGTKPFTQR